MTYEELISKAREIKTETSDRANTAQRVGGWMESALYYLKSAIDGKTPLRSEELVTQSKNLIGAINELASLPCMSEERYDSVIRELVSLSQTVDGYSDTLQRAYDNAVGRRIHFDNPCCKELFRISYVNNNSGRETSFRVMVRSMYSIVAVIDYVLIVGKASSDGRSGEYIDLNYLVRYAKSGFDVSEIVCAERIQDLDTATNKEGVVVVYFKAAYEKMVAYLNVSARYPELNQIYGTLDFSNLGALFTPTEGRVIATPFSSDSPTPSGGGSASDISFDDETSQMGVDNVQDAIDKIAENLGVISSLTEEDWEAIRAAGGIQSEVDVLAAVLDGYITEPTPTPTEEWVSLDIANGTPLNGWWIDGDCKWYSSSACTMRYIAIPEGTTKVKITANNDYATFGAIVKSVNTGSRVLVDTADGVSGRLTILKTESQEFEVGEDAKYVVYSVSSNGTYNQVPSDISCYVVQSNTSLRSGSDDSTPTISKVKDDINRLDDEIEELRESISGDSAPTNYYRVPVSFGNPSQSIKIIGNKDTDATDDAYVLNSGQLIQIGKYFYLFYIGLPSGATSETQYHILSAYSADGLTWQRGFPDGITPPVAGTNRLLSESGLIEHCVIEVPDSEYPYRLLCNKIVSSSSQSMRMYKSADGINYSLVCTFLNEKHDSQMSAICKGNTIEVYTRIWDSAHTNRQVGALTIDLNGNIVKPLHIVLGDYLYNSAAIPIDLHRELWFPTWYIGVNVSTQQDMHLECYQMQDEKAIKLNTNINQILNSNEYWALVCPGVITINGQKYIAVNAWKRHHYSISGDVNEMETRLVPINIG